MSKLCLFFFLVISLKAESQLVIQELDFNSARARVGNDGMVLNYSYTNTPGYRIPKNSQTALIYSMQIWMGGIDSQGTLRTAFGPYNFLTDFTPGPVSTYNFYSSNDYQVAYSQSIWMIEKSEIEYHIQNYNSPGYVMPQSILTWPGNGYYSLGVSEQLAPYMDFNGDGVYSPHLGDYPLIKGDKMCYTILNDVANSHVFGGVTTGMEVHVSAYQFNTLGYLDSTTFFNIELRNRLGFEYPDFKFGFNLDSDVGNGGDDYTGSDSTRNLIYAYNMDNEDNWVFGYGLNPPAVGLVSLSRKINKAGSYIAYGPIGYNLPLSESEIWNYMNGKWENGEDWLYGGMGYSGSLGVTSQQTNFLFSGNPNSGAGWTELSDSNPIGDRCNFMVLDPFSSTMNQQFCMDFAIVYSRRGNNLENVDHLFEIVDSIQFFKDDNKNLFCDDLTVSVKPVLQKKSLIYPNPSNGVFFVKNDNNQSDLGITINDLQGNSVPFELKQEGNLMRVDLRDHKGVFFVTVRSNGNLKTDMLIMQ